ncbi:hypothetical protein I9W82_000755 [Candida metapsilosis]|uniref:Uncharacterized protein n=1 Tax=Candida metapsilosis TaxID=273372 RepID=A0A8H7ZH56_9ASCO|nr:hypothetical protein I9W82_000755 [Candida metapsilosis]
MVLNIFQKREIDPATATTIANSTHDELQNTINYSNQQQQTSVRPRADYTTLLPLPRLQNSPPPVTKEPQPQKSSSCFPSNASRRRTYISNRINLPSANKSGSTSPPTKSTSKIPVISESTEHCTPNPPTNTPANNAIHASTATTNSSHNNTPTHSPDLANKSNLKRGASPKESEIAKKTQISNEVLNQRRARRMRARSKPSATKVTTRRQQERRNSIASRESRESGEQKRRVPGSSESLSSQSKASSGHESAKLTKQQQQMRSMIEQEHKRNNMHSSRPVHSDQTPKPRFSLPYPVNDEIISIIITDEVDEPEESTQRQISEVAQTTFPQLSIEEEETEFPAGFEPISNTRNFRVGNIPTSYTYSTTHSPIMEEETGTPRESQRSEFNPITPRNHRNEVHNDTLQLLTGGSESSSHSTSQQHLRPSPMQPTASEQSTDRPTTDDFVISGTEAVACILERTGSTAQGSRRGQRYQEMRRRQQRGHTRPSPEEPIQQQTSSGSNGAARTINNDHHSLNTNSNANTSPSLQQHLTSLSRHSTIEDTRARIIARLNQRIDPSMYPTTTNSHHNQEEEAPPPLDEYAHLHRDPPSTPPYRERLHKKVDLISFDPRYVTPVLRINKKLIRTPTNLRKTIRKLIQLKIVPEEIDLWKIDRIDDGQFYHVLPQLLNGEDTQEEIRAMSDAVRVARERTELEFEQEIQRAIAISMEEQTQRQLFHGFRYNGPRRGQQEEGAMGAQEQEQEEEEEEDYDDASGSTEDTSAINDVFINVDDALRVWQEQRNDDHYFQPHIMPGSFDYLLPARANSSASSYMTAV